MPRIIRTALYKKIRELPELVEFQRDFELVSGMELTFVNEVGLGGDLRQGRLPLCAAINASDAGRAMCSRTRQTLLAKARNTSSCGMCDAGLSEVVIPVKVSGIRAGYFIFGGTAVRRPGRQRIQKVRHLLRNVGVEFGAREIEALLVRTPVVSAETMGAYQRLCHLAVRQIAMKVTDLFVDSKASMPPPVVKACGFIRARATQEDINLKMVARHSCVSEGHLSRIFHHSTGLTFREYLTQVRVERAKHLLLHTGKSITEIAYESGFQSLSQFHRMFRKVYGMSPREMRAIQRGKDGP